MLEHEPTGRLATVRTTVGERGRNVDLLLASSGIEAEVIAAADAREVFPGCLCPVARIAHLIALKVLARDDRARPQDRVDLQALLAVADRSELALAREALALIEARGFHRGKDLQADLDAAIRELG